jgi:DNA-directed RNA polymerase specialized sigma24 family protein
VNGRDKALAEIDTAEAPFDFEAFFRCQYSRTAGVIARVIRDPARSEELAVEAFWKLWRHPRVHGEKAAGWLYRAAVTLVLPLPLERGT